MDTLYNVLLGISILLIFILLVLIYSGLLTNIVITRGASPYPAFVVCYKFSTGPYQNVGKVFGEILKLAPDNDSFGIYYDDPETVPGNELRWAVGSIICEGETNNNEALTSVMQGQGYTVKVLPKVDNVVKTRFPYKNQLSMYMAIFLVWRKLAAYIKKNDCEADPWMEIYGNDEIKYVGILDHHADFYVEGAKEAEAQRSSKK